MDNHERRIDALLKLGTLTAEYQNRLLEYQHRLLDLLHANRKPPASARALVVLPKAAGGD
jgi:hypothetical protein